MGYTMKKLLVGIAIGLFIGTVLVFLVSPSFINRYDLSLTDKGVVLKMDTWTGEVWWTTIAEIHVNSSLYSVWKPLPNEQGLTEKGRLKLKELESGSDKEPVDNCIQE